MSTVKRPSPRNVARTDADEATRIYAAIFGRPIPEKLAERFAAVSDLLDERATAEDLRHYQMAIVSTADLESLEVASRYARQLPILVAKFEVMVRLAETLPGNQEFFINEETRRWKAWLVLAKGALVTLVKLAKGMLLLARVPRV